MSETFVSLLGNKIGTLRLPLVEEGEIKPVFRPQGFPRNGHDFGRDIPFRDLSGQQLR
jgi:hypothetical protein